MEYTMDERLYTMNSIQDYLSCIDEIPIITKQGRGRSKKCYYYNAACAFDIEASSWYENKKKRAAMYIWQLGICGRCLVGRTWREFKRIVKKICKKLDLSPTKRLVVYVHNLGYEYQFIRKHFKFIEVFEVADRKPIRATTADGIEFRCSYMLSGKSLEKTADDLLKYKVKKAVGQLDYSKIRHSQTPLTESEMEYCVNDIKVVMAYIQEKIEQDGDITKIPLTQTGYVRNFCRDKCFGYGDERAIYAKKMRQLTLTDDLYDMCKRAFQGGYVHCNAYYAGQKLFNIDSYDFISSYPATMVAHQFPMSEPIDFGEVTIEQYEQQAEFHCCLADMTFYNLSLRDDVYMAPISESKCSGELGYIDNGRVINATTLTTTITEQDYFTYKDFYTWDKVEVTRLVTFDKGYLPTPLVDAILELYENKTMYKGIEEKELEYMIAKAMLNALYGMCVTDIFKQCDSVESYNSSFNRFLYYPWGVWVTAISRRALFTGIKECGEDIVYCDTDSLKMTNGEAHKAYIEEYNKNIVKLLDDAMLHHGFNKERTRPRDIKGIKRQLGIWDYEGQYEEFKGIRAKAYIGKKNGKYELTLSGVGKTAGLEYLQSKGNPVDELTFTTVFPAGSCGKLVHTYIDDEISGTVTDYMGTECSYNEKSFIHMEDASYDMRYENEYFEFVSFLIEYIIK